MSASVRDRWRCDTPLERLLLLVQELIADVDALRAAFRGESEG